MRAFLKKSTAVALTALLLGLGVAATTTTPADAAGVWHPGYWRGGHWYGGWWGPAVGLGILGLAAGAAIASQGPYYGPGLYYGPGPNGCTAYQPVYDQWGRYLGRRWVNICR